MTAGTDILGAMPDAQYHADPCEVPSLSSSIAKALVTQSPAHAWLLHPRLGGRSTPPTAATDNGTLCHSMLLGTNDAKVLVLPEEYDSYRKKAAQELRDEARAKGAIPLLAKEMAAIREAYAALFERFCRKGIELSTGSAEQVIVWEEVASSGRKVQCRAKLDHWNEPVVTDLKSTRDASLTGIQRSIVTYGYDIQAAAYLSALDHVYPELLGRTRYRWVFFETSEPYAVTRCRPSEMSLQIGRMKWARAVDIWDQCTHSGEWPDYETTELVIDPPAYEMNRVLALAEQEGEA